jgi:hypothetical protein
VQGNDVPSDDVQGGTMQRVVVFSLGELRPRPSWCAGGLRVMDIRGRRGEGNGRSPAALWTARGEFGGGQVRADLDPREGGEAFMARQVGRRNCGAKAAVRRDELGGASMQPSTAVLQEATRVCRPCFSGTRA